jgi:signal peptidase
MKILLIGNQVIPEYQMSGILQESSVQAQILACTQKEMAEEIVKKMDIDLVYAYADFSNDLPALIKLLRQLKDVKPNLYCMLMIYHQDFGEVDEDLQEVIDDFITVPLEASEFAVRLRKAKQRITSSAKIREQNNITAATLPYEEYQHRLIIDTLAKPHNNEIGDSYDRGPSRGAKPVNLLNFTPDEKRELYKTLVQDGSTTDGQSSWFRSALSLMRNIILGLLILMIVILVTFLVQIGTTGKVPTVLGYQINVCMNGSMSPIFDKGSLVLTRYINPEAIQEGDIIAFRIYSTGVPTTIHRVVKVNQTEGLSFITRGDANEKDDPIPVPAETVIGKLHSSVSYAGYLFSFAQSILGMVLIYTFAVLFVLNGLRNIFNLYMQNSSRAESQA